MSSIPVQVWGESDRGRARPINEDSFYCPTKQTQGFPKIETGRLIDKGHLLIIADGIGGSTAGQEASREVVRALRSVYYESTISDPQQNLAAAVKYANDSLYQLRVRNPALGSSGSTLVAGAIIGDKLYLANVGDSRAYLVRGGKAYQSTIDHTLVQEKTERGLPITDQDRSIVTRSMGASQTVQVDVRPPVTLMDGDAVVLCSDGLSDVVSDDEIGRVVSSKPPRLAVPKLINLANSRGGPDNITIIAAAFGKTAVMKPSLTQRQIAILAGLGVIGVALLVALIAILSGNNVPGVQLTATPTTTSVVAPSSMPTHTPTVAASPTEGVATSTSVPTHTPTNTRRPPTDTPTFTPVPTDTPTITPESQPPPSGDNGNGNDNSQPTPEPQPTR